jgi:transcriptional regulator
VPASAGRQRASGVKAVDPSKQETHKVVPTWNYRILNVHGRLRAHDDQDWLLDHVTKLTDHQESGRSTPWKVADAP